MRKGIWALTACLVAGCAHRQDPGDVAVPFESPRSQIVLTATIGDRSDLRFLLDTGGDPSAIDLVTARELGLPVDTTVSGEASGVGSERITIFPAEIRGLRMGAAEFPPIEALAIDLSAISERLGYPLAGILGYSFLRDRIVEIDYPARRLRLLSDRPVYPPGALKVPLTTTPEDRIPLLEGVVQVNGAHLPVTLDTGSSLTLEVFPAAREVLGDALWGVGGDTSSVVGARGSQTVKHVEVNSLAIGPWELASRDVVLTPRGGEDSRRLGNLGNGALADFILTLDYRNGEIVLWPSATGR